MKTQLFWATRRGANKTNIPAGCSSFPKSLSARSPLGYCSSPCFFVLFTTPSPRARRGLGQQEQLAPSSGLSTTLFFDYTQALLTSMPETVFLLCSC
ncbi:hypothetical protein GQ607_001775 [Colletotrichum asianum]|uniref:Uncharacterized protein n=1 Tax=Colletotrichum asianum TaxID=702518 RepID=A0A8H3WRW9_9PEZI|nr:hypothetical protein GQ607_001775 [Colletotrichum asianum]